tara:strand:- start:484 stop:1014 length:531 start_codon:yes stop_codon:yes gene_type:complete
MEFPEVAPCNYNPNYLVYSDGSLYCSRREEYKAVSTNGKRSPYVHYIIPSDVKGKKPKKFYVHRLVAEHFLPNPDNLRDVHHKDNNPKNNDVSNLEWLSHKDNCHKKIGDPIKIVARKPNAYIYNWKKPSKEGIQYKMFCFRGLINCKIPPKTKYFKDLESAKEFRDFYFLTQSAI